MALQNPSNLYSGGQVMINSTPFTNFVLQTQAKKKAKDEAVTQYFTHLPDKLNTAGVRKQDLQDPAGNGGILKDMDGIREYWMANKEAIKRGGAAQQAYMNRVQQVANNIERSKSRGKTQLDIGKATFEGKFRPRHDDLPVIDRLDKSIYDPQSKKEDGVSEYGFQHLSGSVPRFDVNKQKQFDALTLGVAKPVYDEGKARVDNVTGEVFIPKTFDAKSINTSALTAANVLKSDKSALYHYEDLLEDENAVKQLTDVFQNFYKTDEIVDTPEKAAMADRIMKLQAAAGEEKVRDVNYADKLKRGLMDKRREESMEDWRTKNKITYQQSLNKISANKAAGLPPEDLGYLSDNVADEVGVNEIVTLGGKQREVRVIYTDLVDPKRLSIINANNAVKPIPIKQPNGKTRMGYYQDPVTGDWEGLDSKGNLMKASRERIKDDYIKTVAPTKFKAGAGTQASENTKKGKYD